MRGHCSNASTLPGGSPTFSTRRDSRRRPLIRRAGMRPSGADQRRGNPHPHHRRRKRRVRVGGVRIQAQQVAVGFGGARRQRPGPQLAGTGQPLRRHGLDGPTGPVARDGHQPRVRRGAHQRSVLVGAGDLWLQSGLGRSSPRGPRRATADRRPQIVARLGRSPTEPAPPGRVRRGSRSGRRPRAAPTLPRRTTAGSRNRQ